MCGCTSKGNSRVGALVVTQQRRGNVQGVCTSRRLGCPGAGVSVRGPGGGVTARCGPWGLRSCQAQYRAPGSGLLAALEKQVCSRKCRRWGNYVAMWVH